MSLRSFTEIRSSLQYYLEKIFQTFPHPRFVLLGDTTNTDIMEQYPAIYKKYSDQVQCIFIRNTTTTDEENGFGYDNSGFKRIPEEVYMFFNVPDDLENLDIANGECRNSTLPSPVEYGIQGSGAVPYPTDEDGDNGAHAGAIFPVTVMVVLFLHGVCLGL